MLDQPVLPAATAADSIAHEVVIAQDRSATMEVIALVPSAIVEVHAGGSGALRVVTALDLFAIMVVDVDRSDWDAQGEIALVHIVTLLVTMTMMTMTAVRKFGIGDRHIACADLETS